LLFVLADVCSDGEEPKASPFQFFFFQDDVGMKGSFFPPRT